MPPTVCKKLRKKIKWNRIFLNGNHLVAAYNIAVDYVCIFTALLIILPWPLIKRCQGCACTMHTLRGAKDANDVGVGTVVVWLVFGVTMNKELPRIQMLFDLRIGCVVRKYMESEREYSSA